MADPSDGKDAQFARGEAETSGTARSAQAAPVTFSDLVMSIAANAVAHLGGEDEVADRVPSRSDLQLAAHHVDMLAMLQEKTRGNLEPEEQHILGTLLYELRMKYLEAAQRAG